MKMIHNDDPAKVFRSTVSGYKGQITIKIPGMNKSAASVGRFMLLGKGLRNDDSGRITLLHEHGHFLDYKKLGFFKYFLGIGLPSLINASRKPEKRRIKGYYNQPWEFNADVQTGIVRDEHTKKTSALSKAYYGYLSSIKRFKWFKFLFKDLKNIINHDFTACLTGDDILKKGYVIGVDAGGTKVAYGLFNEAGKLVDRFQHATDPGADGPEFADTLVENIKLIITKNDLTFDMLAGVGIGMPSFINNKDGFIYMTSSMTRIKNFPMREYMEAKLPVRIVLDNDANTAALAEFRHGAGQGTRHMVYVVIGTGLGCGLIIDGKVFSGSYGAAGESGHMLITPDRGTMCGCENPGCFMSYVAGRNLSERIRIESDSGVESVLSGSDVTGVKLLQAYNINDSLAVKQINDMAHYLAVHVYNIYQLLNIDTFIFGGGLTGLGDALFIKMREEFDKYNHIPFPVSFKQAELKEDIGIIGAAEIVKG